MLKTYTRKQNIIVLIIILGVLVLTSLPYIVGVLINSNDYFLGGNHLNQTDLYVYISHIEQIKDGKILVANLFTSEKQTPVFFTPLWLVLGFIAKIFNLNVLLVFQLARIIIGLIFLYFIFYYFLGLFFKKFFDKIIAFILISFSSGLGLFFKPDIKEPIFNEKFVFEHFPSDLIMSEANTFMTLSHSSLAILSQLLILLIFYLFLKKFKFQNLFYLFLISLLLGFLHSYDLIIVLSVLGVYFLVLVIFNFITKESFALKKFLAKYAVIFLGFLPALAYFYLVLLKEPAILGWIQQNVTPSPPFKNYLIGFSILIVFSLISLFIKTKSRFSEKKLFLLCWILVIFYLVYSPFDFQRRLINTLHIALAILASYSFIVLIKELLKIYKDKLKNILLVIFLFIFISLSNFSFLTTAVYDYLYLPQYFYFPAKYYQAALWLKDNSLDNEAVLADKLNGGILPAINARPVFFGHVHQTIDFWTKKRLLEDWFFKDNKEDSAKQTFLQNYNIKYIFYTEREKQLGDYDLEQQNYLEKVYANEEVKIYAVKDSIAPLQ